MAFRALVLVLTATSCATVSPQVQGSAVVPGSSATEATPRQSGPAQPMPTPIDDLWTDIGDAFWGYNLFYYAGAFAATGIMSQSGADHELRQRFEGNDHETLTNVANISGYVVPMATAPTLWVAGLLSENRNLAGAGSAAILALSVTTATIGILKISTGRPDPGALDDEDLAREFSPFQNDIGAWPSGHTAGTVSIAAALTAYAPEHWWIPLIGYPLGLALGIGMVERDSHWASDVVAGALIGHGIGYSIGRNFRARVRGEPRTDTSLQLAPMRGARGVAVTGRF